MEKNTHIQRALISVSDKTNIIQLCEYLHSIGTEILSTGNTAKILEQHHIPVTKVEDYTSYPEMLDGRVKTLHPKIHAGILGRRDIDSDFMRQQSIPDIDLVVVNLYPFAQTVAKGASRHEVIENIDIGGPTMIRAAAKNSAWCTVLVSPLQYQDFIDTAKKHENQVPEQFRIQCMHAAFKHTAEYELAIDNYFNVQSANELPERIQLSLVRKQSLRYGENPHQQAALYTTHNADQNGIATCIQHQGKDLSFNNINDAETALECVKSFDKPTCVIVKHANPCGVASRANLLQAYQDAFACDPESAFGGIIAFNQTVNKDLISHILDKQFVEVIIAPSYADEALIAAKDKSNIRLLAYQNQSTNLTSYDIRSVHGGILVQNWDEPETVDYQVISKKQPTPEQIQNALFAWKVCHYVKSNAIVFAKDSKTLGIGAGQSSRIFSTQIAHMRAQKVKFDLQDAAMASDAFFPFADNVEYAKELGVSTIIQPGGSIRDQEVFARCDELGLIMLTTGTRHFRH